MPGLRPGGVCPECLHPGLSAPAISIGQPVSTGPQAGGLVSAWMGGGQRVGVSVFPMAARPALGEALPAGAPDGAVPVTPLPWRPCRAVRQRHRPRIAFPAALSIATHGLDPAVVTCFRSEAIMPRKLYVSAICSWSCRTDSGLGLFRWPFAAARALPAWVRGPVDAFHGWFTRHLSRWCWRSSADQGRRRAPFCRPASTRRGLLVEVSIAVDPFVDCISCITAHFVSHN